MKKSCEKCVHHAYVCGDEFCKHPDLPETTPTSPWPWLPNSLITPNWCPLIKAINKVKKIQEDIRERLEDGY